MKPKVHVRKGDFVEVIAGDDKGARGRILSVSPAEGRAVVEGVNFVYRHLRPSRRDPQGGRVQREAPVHVSNLMVVCMKCDRPVRVKKKILEDGSRIRVCARCGESVGAE